MENTEIEPRLTDLEESLTTGLEGLLRLTKAVEDQGAVLKSMMFLMDVSMAMIRMHHERLTALEARAGMTFEDLVDGKEMPPLGPSEEHYQLLLKINEGLEQLNRDLT